MKTKLSDMTEHLFEMAERLLDDEVCSDKEHIASEVNKAQAMAGLADMVVKIESVKMEQFNSQIHAMEVANKLGLSYQPKELEFKNKSEIKDKSEKADTKKISDEW